MHKQLNKKKKKNTNAILGGGKSIIDITFVLVSAARPCKSVYHFEGEFFHLEIRCNEILAKHRIIHLLSQLYHWETL